LCKKLIILKFVLLTVQTAKSVDSAPNQLLRP